MYLLKIKKMDSFQENQQMQQIDYDFRACFSNNLITSSRIDKSHDNRRS